MGIDKADDKIGECGEVCEIFQWKGQLEEEVIKGGQVTSLSPAEITHIGEEIADVFIYTTRLCDICLIDLAAAVSIQLSRSSASTLAPTISDDSFRWQHLEFAVVDGFLQNSQVDFEYRSHRHLSLALQSNVGELCSLFADYPECQNIAGLSKWSNTHVKALSDSVGTIILQLFCIAQQTNISIGQCIADKMNKNEIKYPVELAKGSSAKYTAYVKPIGDKSWVSYVIPLIAVAIIGFISGRLSRAV